jgi:hypothetical protein
VYKENFKDLLDSDGLIEPRHDATHAAPGLGFSINVLWRTGKSGQAETSGLVAAILFISETLRVHPINRSLKLFNTAKE